MSRRAKSVQQSSPAPQVAAGDHRERLQKILAAAGLGSRRQCEELIETGRVEVDRQVVTQLGSKADPRLQEIRVDGVALARPRLVHYMLNKPVGFVSTNLDPAGRPRVIDLIPDGQRLFTVGRLDISSEGLILVTNDGDLANRLAHPRYGVEKTYHAEVAGTIGLEDLATLRKGVYLAEGFAKVKHVKVKAQHKQSAILEIVLDEGRNREIRRLLARVGHKVLRLKRIALGPLRLGEVEPGAYRPLTHEELRTLRQATTPEGRKERLRQRIKRAGGPRPGGKSAAGSGKSRPAPSGPARGRSQARAQRADDHRRRLRPRPAGKPAGGKPAGGKTAGGRTAGGKTRPAGKPKSTSRPGPGGKGRLAAGKSRPAGRPHAAGNSTGGKPAGGSKSVSSQKQRRPGSGRALNSLGPA